MLDTERYSRKSESERERESEREGESVDLVGCLFVCGRGISRFHFRLRRYSSVIT